MDAQEAAAALAQLEVEYARGLVDVEEYARVKRELLLASGDLDPSDDLAHLDAALARPSGRGFDAVTGARLAPWVRRAGAYLVDLVVVLAALIPTVAWAISTEDPDTGSIGGAAAVVLSLQLLFLAPLYSWLMLGTWGKTLGKMAMNIAVRRAEDGGHIGYARALGRVGSVIALGIVTPVLILSYLWPLWDARKQALHDKLARTIVVRSAYAGPAVEPVDVVVAYAPQRGLPP